LGGNHNDAALAADVTLAAYVTLAADITLAADAIADATAEAATPATQAPTKAASGDALATAVIGLTAMTIRGFGAACERHCQHYTVHETPPANEQWNTTHALYAKLWAGANTMQIKRATS